VLAIRSKLSTIAAVVFVAKKWRRTASEIVFVDTLFVLMEHGNVTDKNEFQQTGRSENGQCGFLVWFCGRILKVIEILSYFSFSDLYTAFMFRKKNQTWNQYCPFNYLLNSVIICCVRYISVLHESIFGRKQIQKHRNRRHFRARTVCCSKTSFV